MPVTLLRIPYSLSFSIVWSCIVYWPTNLAPEAGRFFTYILILFLLHKCAPALPSLDPCARLAVLQT